MPQSENSLPDPDSRTKRRDEMTQLQKLGEALIKLSPSELAKIPMPDNLRAAIEFAHTLKTHEAIRRHKQLIGKMMRQLEAEPIKAAMEQTRFTNEQKTQQFHEVEKWRDRLIIEGDQGIQAFLVEYPSADRQQLRQLIRKAVQDRANNKNTGGETALFRYLRDLIH